MALQKLGANPNTANLRGLCIIRSLVIAGQVGTVFYAEAQLGWLLPYVTLKLLLGAISVFALFSWWRSFRSWPVTDIELFVHLCVDILGFSAVLYFSGGANNPFISYLLVPLCISAATLPWAYAWTLSALACSAYSLLLFFFIPLEAISPLHHQHEALPNTHIIGMWGSFLVSALLISYFVFKMAHRLRQREAELARSREYRLQDDQLLAVATLAAGTAHELGTPLSTMKVILEDLADQQDPENAEDITLLQQQLDQCKDILSKLVSTARDLSESEFITITAKQYLSELIERWQVLRPACELTSKISNDTATISLHLDGTVSQAILNLLNNAADVSPNNISLEVRHTSSDLIFAIKDRGPGLSPQQANLLTKAFVSTKGKGRGLGLFLSHATANRYGGTLSWQQREGGGSHVELRLPLSKISEGA
ncbi:Sensor histidine kinase RegB [Zhongshania aliphaticivorans]|uniref:histidine kinase n=2 Tax=Zhongshania aliphaticivorans TaxID=1470434 RepID=A0A5S9N884_9GAMM|nr:Sensor histidine kinase RegB [Zhongshania aliphaticivorans]CAA0084308.1 Sensor histidine kinase RegB [Zhongshania aliphaticivorans]